MAAKYACDSYVRINSTNQVASIVKVSETANAVSYTVMIDGKKKRYREEELLPYVDVEDTILKDFEKKNFGTADQLQRYVYFQQFSETQDANIYSYQGNKIMFNPFQYKPLMKFLNIDSDERLLVADEVGVGKTIESGIILDELLARGDLKAKDSILIVCPNILCPKWQGELKNKFQMDDFWVHNRDSLKYSLESIRETGKNPNPHSIVSEQLLRGDRYYKLLHDCLEKQGEPFIQMLIIDECHHYRNMETNTHKVGALLSLCADRVVMLSATPFNLRSDDLFNQLNMLNPALFPDKHTFDILIKQIRNVNQSIVLLRKQNKDNAMELLAMLDELRPMAENNLIIRQEFEELCADLSVGKPMDISTVVRYEKMLNLLNPIASSFTRTLKRDAIPHRVTRDVRTFEVRFTEAEAEIYQEFIDVNMLRHQCNGVSERAFGLIVNGLERIAASSIVALERNIRFYMSKAGLDTEDVITNDLDLDDTAATGLRNVLHHNYKSLIAKVRALNGIDSKYTVFKRLIENIWNTIPENPRVIVFSFYVGTLKYLRQKLSAEGYRVILLYGNTPQDTPSKTIYDEDGFPVIGRIDVMRAFEKGDYDILLASEVGGEGLDFQFCTALINYDLPYNPMRIEQRIGRIDRYGQKSDKIIIGNLCIINTIDMVINDVLLTRIDNAADLIGELEPIIAREMEEMNQLILRKDFSQAELEQRERELIARIEKERDIRQDFDEQRYELVNDKSFRDEFEETIRGSRISPRESLLFTMAFLKNVNGCWSKPLSDTSAVIHITKDMRDKLTNYYRRLDLGTSGIEIKQIYEATDDLTINFDGDNAYNTPGQLFVKPSGAWIRFMVDYIKALYSDSNTALFHVAVKTDQVEKLSKGTYLAFMYEYEFVGFRNQKTIAYILIDPTTDEKVELDTDDWKNIFLSVQTSKKQVTLTIDDLEDARIEADNVSDDMIANMAQDMVSSNDVKIVSRIEAVKKLSKSRINEYENELIGASLKDSERLWRAISKEKTKAEERIHLLEKKKNLSFSWSFQGLFVLEVI